MLRPKRSAAGAIAGARAVIACLVPDDASGNAPERTVSAATIDATAKEADLTEGPATRTSQAKRNGQIRRAGTHRARRARAR
jgi:hypothetical protein